MSASKLGKPKATSKDEIVADIKRVVETNSAGIITRDYYRANGRYSDTGWKFSDLLKAVYSPSIPSSQQTDSSEIDGDTWTVTLSETDISSLDELIASYKVDTTVWQADKFTCNKLKNGPTVRATFKRRKDLSAIKREIAELIEHAKVRAFTPSTAFTKSPIVSGNMLELALPDLHAGKLSWSKETGYQDYDTHIAVETYRRAVRSLLSSASVYTFDQILLVVGNDLLQSDNIQGTTYSGTKVDTDTRFHKTYKIVRQMLAETIEILRLIAPVEVKLVPGNHDTLSTFTIGDSLDCLFHKYPDVNVDNSPTLHKLVEWGQNLLLLTHGHQGKQADYGIWLATEFPKEFGRTAFREIHVGHKHKSALEEKFGVRVRTLSALCPPDAWHAANHFVGNTRTAEAFVFNKSQGLIAQFYHNEVD